MSKKIEKLLEKLEDIDEEMSECFALEDDIFTDCSSSFKYKATEALKINKKKMRLLVSERLILLKLKEEKE
jgi:hypothetical protein